MKPTHHLNDLHTNDCCGVCTINTAIKKLTLKLYSRIHLQRFVPQLKSTKLRSDYFYLKKKETTIQVRNYKYISKTG